MKYIALLYGEPGAGPAPGTPEFMEMLGEFESATQASGCACLIRPNGRAAWRRCSARQIAALGAAHAPTEET